MAIQAVPAYLQNASHSAAVFRQATSGMFASGGILAAGELTLTAQATPNMSVLLGAGRAKVTGNSVSAPSGVSFTTQAMYDTLNDAPLSITVSASNPTNPRIDAVYDGVQDSFYSGSTNTAVVGIVTGTPAASPVAPAIPTNSILIAYIAVAANATTIVTANISYQAVVASPIPNAATNAAIAAAVARAGNTVVTPSSFSGTGVVQNANGSLTLTSCTTLDIVFVTSAYDNYTIQADLMGPATGSAGISTMQFLTALGSPDVTASYTRAGLYFDTSTVTHDVGSTGNTSGDIGFTYAAASGRQNMVFEFYNLQKTEYSRHFNTHLISGQQITRTSSLLVNASHVGIRLTFALAVSGVMRITGKVPN